MNALVLGGTGVLGRPVTEALLAAGHEVTVLSRGACERVSGARALTVDRGDRAALEGALSGRRFDFTVDLLAYDGDAVTNLLAVPGFSPGRLVLISTGQVYLVTDRRPPFREDDFDGAVIDEPARDTRAWHNWNYGVGKRAAERTLRREAQARGLESIALRIPAVQGELDGGRTGRLWAWIERILDGGPVLLPDNGANRLRFVYAGDVARAIVTLAARGSWEGIPAVNLAQPSERTLRAFVTAVAACVGRSPEWVPVDGEALDQAGIPENFVPYQGPWWSRPDPSLGISRLGLAPRDEEEWLPRVVRAHLDAPPARSHEGYVHRPRELAWVRAHG
jgi:nucleoside-diphosphate-sugar epimerase